MKHTFPTLSEIPREAWPTWLRLRAPLAHVEGDVEMIVCPHCRRPVLDYEMLDFRCLTTVQRARVSLDAELLCVACFNLAHVHGKLVHSEIAKLLNLHPRVELALQQGETYALAHGHMVRSVLNTHLYPV